MHRPCIPSPLSSRCEPLVDLPHERQVIHVGRLPHLGQQILVSRGRLLQVREVLHIIGRLLRGGTGDRASGICDEHQSKQHCVLHCTADLLICGWVSQLPMR